MRKDCERFICGVRSVTAVQSTAGLGCLTQACVAENDIKDDGATALAGALSHLVELRELDVAGPPALQAVETNVLAKCIPCMHCFAGYFSADNNFGQAGAVAIANALEGVTNLRGLHLAGV